MSRKKRGPVQPGKLRREESVDRRGRFSVSGADEPPPAGDLIMTDLNLNEIVRLYRIYCKVEHTPCFVVVLISEHGTRLERHTLASYQAVVKKESYHDAVREMLRMAEETGHVPYVVVRRHNGRATTTTNLVDPAELPRLVRREADMETHRIGEAVFAKYEAGEIPTEIRENPVFRLHADSIIHAVYEQGDDEGNMLALCYREHADGPLISRLRSQYPGSPTKTVYELGSGTPAAAVTVFEGFRQEFGGQLLTPDRLRGRYCAFCRMLGVEPLERS